MWRPFKKRDLFKEEIDKRLEALDLGSKNIWVKDQVIMSDIPETIAAVEDMLVETMLRLGEIDKEKDLLERKAIALQKRKSKLRRIQNEL